MTFDEACRIKNPAISWRDKTDRYIRFLSRDEVKKHLPAPVAVLAREYLGDQHFNNMKLSVWETAAGYAGFKDAQGNQNPVSTGPFALLCHSKGITWFPMSTAISILKRCAELEVLDYLNETLGNIQGPRENRKIEMWAIFESQHENPDPMNRHNIFDYDCIAVVWTESEAIKWELENKAYRVRKLIRVPASFLA